MKKKYQNVTFQKAIPLIRSNLTMKSQFLICWSFIFVFFSIITYLIIYYSGMVIIKFMFDSSQKMNNRLVKNLVTSQQFTYNKWIEQFLQQNSLILLANQNFYINFLRQNKKLNQPFNENFIYDFMGVNPIPQLITHTSLDVSYSVSCYYGWKAQNNQTMQFVQEFGPTSQIFFHSYKPLNLTSQFYYLEEENLVQIYPCYHIGQNIQQQKIETQIQWYQEAKRLFKQIMEQRKITTSISRTYIALPQLVSFTQVLPIIDENLNFRGVWCYNTFANEVRKFFDVSSIFKQNLILVVDQVGMLLVHNYSQYMNQPIYFFNQTITGFNKLDWNSLTSTNQSECKGILDMICLKNSINKQDYNINVYHNKKYLYYIFLLVSDQDYMEFQNEFFNQFHEFINTKLQRYIQTFFYLSILLIIIVYLLGHLLFNPLNKFLQIQQNQLIKRNYDLFLSQQRISYSKLVKNILQQENNSCYINSQIKKFIFAFKKTQYKFSRLQIRKSQVCLEQENIEYPAKSWSYIKRCWKFAAKLYQIIEQTQDERKPTYSFILYDDDEIIL